MNLKQLVQTRPQVAEREFFEKLQKVRADYGSLSKFYNTLRPVIKPAGGTLAPKIPSVSK